VIHGSLLGATEIKWNASGPQAQLFTAPASRYLFSTIESTLELFVINC
jgi:hypothetical protein